jgi:hypothetical protein
MSAPCPTRIGDDGQVEILLITTRRLLAPAGLFEIQKDQGARVRCEKTPDGDKREPVEAIHCDAAYDDNRPENGERAATTP